MGNVLGVLGERKANSQHLKLSESLIFNYFNNSCICIYMLVLYLCMNGYLYVYIYICLNIYICNVELVSP